MYSPFFYDLEKSAPDVAKRYQEKIRDVGDPFLLEWKELEEKHTAFPPISLSHLRSNSYYTNDQFKPYKTLLSCKYFEAGHVYKVGVKVYDDIFLIVGEVYLFCLLYL